MSKVWFKLFLYMLLSCNIFGQPLEFSRLIENTDFSNVKDSSILHLFTTTMNLRQKVEVFLTINTDYDEITLYGKMRHDVSFVKIIRFNSENLQILQMYHYEQDNNLVLSVTNDKMANYDITFLKYQFTNNFYKQGIAHEYLLSDSSRRYVLLKFTKNKPVCGIFVLNNMEIKYKDDDFNYPPKVIKQIDEFINSFPNH